MGGACSRKKHKNSLVENPEFRPLVRLMYMVYNIKIGLREIYCNDVELIYLLQE
jgi:hypothetical protein